MESLKNIKIRIPTPPTGTAFKSIKDYNRRNNKKSIEEGLDDYSPSLAIAFDSVHIDIQKHHKADLHTTKE